MNAHPRITELLLECRNGGPDAYERLLPLVYEQLRAVARSQLRRERDGHTLSPTALVHEAYLKLVDPSGLEVRDRAHFFAVAARAMRQVLIDHARRHQAPKRGGDLQRVDLDAVEIAAGERAEVLLALDEALGRLGALNPRLSQLVELRFFGGLTEEETAEVLGVTSRTVRRDWIKARGWLHEEIARGHPVQ
jgi:RNA polymerase sigma factor (TIGR02999 family)